MKIKKTLSIVAVTAALLFGATACGESFTFEATPVGVDDDDAEDGLEGDMKQYECFTIEADSSSSDDGDQQLGTFCRVDAKGQPVEDDD